MGEFDQFNFYRKYYTDNCGERDYCSIDHLLRFWRENKGQYLMKMFDDQLILERPIEYRAETTDLQRDMNDAMIEIVDALDTLRYSLKNAMHIDDRFWYSDNDDCRLYRYLTNSLTHADMLIANQINLSVLFGKPSETLMINNHKITIQDGQKVTRVWTALAKALEKEDVWERVRVMHAQIMNQQYLKGTLCLSIHPLDYATASDNENGWSSCMSWKEEGCYRLGTVEMMNSPMVICAYLKSNKQHMTIDGQEWNSKKWRAWILVNDKVILCNRHYPYHQDEFARQACEWVRELAEKACGWHYGAFQSNLIHYLDDNSYWVHFETKYMYNDIGGADCMGMISPALIMHQHYRINFSGPAECMICGDEIISGNPDGLVCDECGATEHCECCGCTIDHDDIMYGPNDEIMCHDCYDERCCVCDECDTTVWSDDVIEVTVPVYRQRALNFINKHPFLQNRFSDWGQLWIPDTMNNMCLCPHCASEYQLIRCTFNADNDTRLWGRQNIIDPRKITPETMYDLLRPNSWNAAHSKYTHMSKEEQQLIIDYYNDQFEAFKDDIENNKNRNVKEVLL